MEVELFFSPVPAIVGINKLVEIVRCDHLLAPPSCPGAEYE